MIYLIDDKKQRQKDYGWNIDIFEKYKEYIIPIYNSTQIKENRVEIFSKSDNIVLLHESFFDTLENKHTKDSINIRNELFEYSQKNSSFTLAIFSGSKNSRVKISDAAHLPVSILYQNLEVFLRKYSNDDINLDYLLFGENYRIEEIFSVKHTIYKNLFNKSKLDNIEIVKEEINKLNELTNSNIKLENDMSLKILKAVLNV